MTSTKEQDTNASRLEKMLKGIEKDTSKIREIVSGMYEQVSDLVGSTTAIYDLVAFRQNIREYENFGYEE